MLVLVHFPKPASHYAWMNSLETVQYWTYNNLRDVISFEFCLNLTSCHTSIIPHELHAWANKGYQALSYDQSNRSTWEQDYYIHSNLWNVLIIGMPNFNYSIRSNLWKEQIIEINNHSNCSNWQVQLSYIFCYNDSSSYYQLLPIERYVAGNRLMDNTVHVLYYPWSASIHLEWVESAVTFRIHFSSMSQTMPE